MNDRTQTPQPVTQEQFEALQASVGQCVTKDQLEELASKVMIALHSLLDGLEILAINSQSIGFHMPDMNEKIDRVNLY